MNDDVQSASPQQTRRIGLSEFRKTISHYPVTYSVIGVTIIVFLFQWIVANVYGNGFVCGSGDLICQGGAKVNAAISEGQVWRFVSPIFIHVDALHIFINMYSLHAIGRSIERFFGKERTVIVYMLSGICGVAFSLAFSPLKSVGASGAIFGMVGAFALFLFLHRDLFGSVTKDLLMRIAMVVLLNLTLGFSPLIDNWGHVGGLLGGIWIGWIIRPRWEKVQILGQPIRVVDKRSWKKVRLNSLFAVGFTASLCLVAIFSPFNR